MSYYRKAISEKNKRKGSDTARGVIFSPSLSNIVYRMAINMKKIIRRVFLCILTFIVVVIAALAVYITHDPDKSSRNETQPKVTDPAGNTYLAVTDEDGEKFAAVTDAVGKVFAAKINSDGSIGEAVSSLDGKYTPADLPSNYTGPKIDESVNPNDFTGNINVAAPTSDAATSSEQASSNGAEPPASATKPEEGQKYRIEKYQQIFSGGSYLMEFTTDDEELGKQPITAAVKNGNLLIDAEISNLKCKMLYLAEKDTTYIILDNIKKYCKLPESLMGEDFDLSDMNLMSNFAKETKNKKITVSTVSLNGQELICESYVTDKGAQMMYYFSGDTLVRMDSTDSSGKTVSTYFSRITSDVPDSTFEIPKNYGYFNISWLGALSGVGSTTEKSK